MRIRRCQKPRMFFGYAYSRQKDGPLLPSTRSVRINGCSPFRNTNVPPEDISVIGPSLPLADDPNAKGKVSPTGTNGNPGGMAVSGGRTMKEYEDQLGALKKENFNLKLRIYFLEERMGVSSADEDVIKKNIELKVELESIRKELLEKQELLSQAAKAFELIEEQKKASARNEAQYRKSLEEEQEKIARLEKEVAGYREKSTQLIPTCSSSSLSVSSSTYRRDTLNSLGLSEKDDDQEEKLKRTQELVDSLERLVKQVSASLEEERAWAQELEAERDGLKNRLETELRLKDDLISEKMREIEEFRGKTKEDINLEKEALIQRYESELAEKDRVIKEKVMVLEEKARAYDEATATAERRKRQIDQLRFSVKSRDDALTDLNNKHRALLSQMENGYTKLRLPLSPTKTETEKDLSHSEVSTEVENLSRELDERERELKRQEESRKQLTLKLCNLQKHTEITDQKLKKLEGEHEKAIKTIQGFMGRQKQLEETSLKREKRITELEEVLARNSQDIADYVKTEDCDRQLSDDEDGAQCEMKKLRGMLREKDERIEVLEKESWELKGKVEELEKLTQEETVKREQLVDKEIEERDQKIEQLAKELQMKTQSLQKLVNTELWSKNREIAKLQNHATSGHLLDKGRRLNRLVEELNDVGIEVSFNEDLVRLNYVNGNERIDVRTMTEYVQKLVERKGELEKEVDYLKWLRLVSKPDIASEVEEGCGNETERIRKYCELLRSHLKDLVKFMRDMLRKGEDGVANERKRIVLDVLSSSRILSEDFMHALEGMSVTEEGKNGQDNKTSGIARKSRSNEILIGESRASQSDSEAFSEPDRTVSMARMGLRETRRKSQPRSRYSKYPKENTFSDSEDSSPADCAENKEERKLDSSSVNRENESLRMRLEKLEEETLSAKASVSALTKELDGLTLSHSQLLVENTKLTNDKLRLEQELRKTESRYDAVIRSMRDEFDKEMTEVNRINDSQRARLEELETMNKELGRHVCEASDSPSSSGVSSVPNDGTLKRACEDALQDFRRSCYSNSRYWLPVCSSDTGSRRKANCSPDLGIESDAAVTTIRPLRDTLRITESMTNLLSDEDGIENRERVDSESPLPIEGLDEVEALKQENDSLKRRLTKTRRALEDTFRHLSASNKNKRNVEKAITKQLMITRSVLKKTRTYEESLDD